MMSDSQIRDSQDRGFWHRRFLSPGRLPYPNATTSNRRGKERDARSPSDELQTNSIHQFEGPCAIALALCHRAGTAPVGTKSVQSGRLVGDSRAATQDMRALKYTGAIKGPLRHTMNGFGPKLTATCTAAPPVCSSQIDSPIFCSHLLRLCRCCQLPKRLVFSSTQ